MLRRKIYNDLVAWKQRSGGTTALLIDGARRVGKSFIAKEFAANEYKAISLLISEMSRRMCWTSLKMTAPTSICFCQAVRLLRNTALQQRVPHRV